MTLDEIETVVAAYKAALKARQALPSTVETDEQMAHSLEVTVVYGTALHALMQIAPDAVCKLLQIAKAAAKFDESDFVQFNPETDKYECVICGTRAQWYGEKLLPKEHENECSVKALMEAMKGLD